MILSYKTLSNKILQTVTPINEGYNQVESLRKMSSTAQSTHFNRKRIILKNRNNFTLSEYLNKIIAVSQGIEQRGGFAQVLDSKIDNLKTKPNMNLKNSSLGYNNFLRLDKNSTETYADLSNSNTGHNKSIKGAEYSNLVLSQLSELSQFAKFSGVSSILSSANKISLAQDGNQKVEYNIRHYLNLLTKFEYKLSNSYYDYFHFNKSNNNKYLFAMEKATNLLKLAFLSKGCLISKPIFNIVYTPVRIEDEISNSYDKTSTAYGGNAKIIINLFYFVNSALTINNTEVNGTGLQNKRILQRKLYENKLNNILQSINTTQDSQTTQTSSNRNITTIFNDKFLYLSEYLNKLFNCDVELNLVRLYLPYQDSNILAQYLNIGSFKKRFVYLASRLFRKVKIFNNIKIASRRIKTTHSNGKSLPACILNGPFGPLGGEDTALTTRPFRVEYPSGVSGINIKLAGRTPTQKLIPRVAVRRAQRGNFSRLNSKMIEKSMCIDTSKKGAFNFTVRLSHIFR